MHKEEYKGFTLVVRSFQLRSSSRWKARLNLVYGPVSNLSISPSVDLVEDFSSSFEATNAGLLRGKKATTHWAWTDLLTPFGAIPTKGRVVRDGRLMTGGGVTAGIDFALTMVAELAGQDVAESIQLGIEYAPAPPFSAGSPDTARPELVAAVRDRMTTARVQREARVAKAAAALG